MKTINLNTGENIKITIFPDKQPHVNISGLGEGEEVKLVCSITDTEKLLLLLETANAIDNCFARKKILVIPYLMAARYDRLMLPGDSLDLKVIADMINYCGFERVYLFDVHSGAALLLIRNAIAISNEIMVREYTKDNAILLCPDEGAAKKTGSYRDWNNHLAEIVFCHKSRDLNTGKITLSVPEPGKCTGRNCVIIDDICDGGGTFLAIAEQIRPAHLTLIVTHGIFSKGFGMLEKHFNEIIVSDSLYKQYESPLVRVVPVTATL